MAALDQMIRDVRSWRRQYKRAGANHRIEAAAAAIREKALLDARAAIIGKIEPGFEFHPVLLEF